MKTIIAFIAALVISMVPFYAQASTGDFVAGALFYWLFLDDDSGDANKQQLAEFSDDENYGHCSIAWKNNLTNENETIKFFLDSFKSSNKQQWEELQNGAIGYPVPTEQEVIELAIEYNKFCNEPWPELVNGVTVQ